MNSGNVHFIPRVSRQVPDYVNLYDQENLKIFEKSKLNDFTVFDHFTIRKICTDSIDFNLSEAKETMPDIAVADFKTAKAWLVTVNELITLKKVINNN